MAKKKDPYDYDVLARNFATLQAQKYNPNITRDSFDWSNENGGLGSVSLGGSKLFDLASVDENENGIANAADIKAAIDNYYGKSTPQVKGIQVFGAPKPPTGPVNQEYGSKIDIMLNNLTKSNISAYDPEDDPLYQSYKEQYGIAGDKAMANTMSAATGVTGGRLNSWAVSAGQQAKSDYDKQLAAQIPALANADYTRQINNINNDVKALQTLIQMENTQYNRGRDAIADERYANELAYNRLSDEKAAEYKKMIDDRDWNYKLDRDAVKDGQWQTEIDIEEYQNAIKNYLDEQRVGISRMNANTAAANSSLAGQKFVYQQGQDAIKNDQWERNFAFSVEKAAQQLEATEGSDVAQMFSFMMQSGDPQAWLVERASEGAISDKELNALSKFLPNDNADALYKLIEGLSN